MNSEKGHWNFSSDSPLNFHKSLREYVPHKFSHCFAIHFPLVTFGSHSLPFKIRWKTPKGYAHVFIKCIHTRFSRSISNILFTPLYFSSSFSSAAWCRRIFHANSMQHVSYFATSASIHETVSLHDVNLLAWVCVCFLKKTVAPRQLELKRVYLPTLED